MNDFKQVKIIYGTEELDRALNGQIDSFENPNWAELKGEFDQTNYDSRAEHVFQLHGYTNNNLFRSVYMRLNELDKTKMTLKFKSNAPQKK